jgi:DNA-binding GntR family transcriptional regulator
MDIAPTNLPASSMTLATRAADRLRRAILEGELRPGARLGIEALRDSLEIGASPLREALSQLAAEGLVQRLDGRGFRVATADAEEFQDLLETRCLTEGAALRASIERGDAAWEEQLLVAHHRLARTPRSLDTERFVNNPAWEAHHRAFHLALLAGCGARGLIAFCAELHDRTTRFRRLSKDMAPQRDVAGEHARLLEVALARRTEEAVQVLLGHYRRTGDLVASSLSPAGRGVEGGATRS